MTADAVWWREAWRAASKRSPAIAAGRGFYGPSHQALLVQETVARLHIDREDSVLDIGCASGFLGEHLFAMGCGYVGVDYEPGMVAAFRARCPTVQVSCATATALPFRSRSFTRTLLSGVLQCLTPDEGHQALEEMHRVTARGGFGLVACVLALQEEDVPTIEKRGGIDGVSTAWLRFDLEHAAWLAGWRCVRWEGVNAALHPSVYHADLLLEAK